MASMKVTWVVVIMCMAVVGAPMMAQAMTCNDVTVNMAQCLSYLMQGGTPSTLCCSGVKNILGSAVTTVDKQTVCNCLKADAARYNINDQYAQALPGFCKVNVPYKISRSTNCARSGGIHTKELNV
ncbi:hypothetical protein JHK84_051078 [Glycine max]|nr:hypothetical protein JHK86_051042 [Glycine max]KAG5095490.1 hypothetical protein JHK84_051078 [Glycine max]